MYLLVKQGQPAPLAAGDKGLAQGPKNIIWFEPATFDHEHSPNRTKHLNQQIIQV